MRNARKRAFDPPLPPPPAHTARAVRKRNIGFLGVEGKGQIFKFMFDYGHKFLDTGLIKLARAARGARGGPRARKVLCAIVGGQQHTFNFV